MFKLTPRLEKVCAYVGRCDTLADIGTDHAFVPITLVRDGKCRRAYACDVGEGPLRNAMQYINDAGLTQRIVTVLSDGFASVPDDWDTAVIAGMGGELIARIISEAAVSAAQTLVLQPMTKAAELRRFLYENGFTVADEDIVREGEKLYTVIKAVHSPCEWDRADVYASRALRAKTYPEVKEYFLRLRMRLERISAAAADAADPAAKNDADRILHIIKEFV